MVSSTSPRMAQSVTVLCDEEAVQSDSWPESLIYSWGTTAKICCSPHVRPRAKPHVPQLLRTSWFHCRKALWHIWAPECPRTAGWNVLFQNKWTGDFQWCMFSRATRASHTREDSSVRDQPAEDEKALIAPLSDMGAMMYYIMRGIVKEQRVRQGVVPGTRSLEWHKEGGRNSWQKNDISGQAAVYRGQPSLEPLSNPWILYEPENTDVIQGKARKVIGSCCQMD